MTDIAQVQAGSHIKDDELPAFGAVRIMTA